MILGVLIAAGMLAYQTNTPLLHGSSAFDNLVVLSPDAGVLRANLQAEVRDERWASRAETRLRANFQEINAEVRTVKCGETLCEAVGTIARPETVPALGAVRLESRDGEQASALQLVRTDASAGSGSEQDRFVVTSYWRRTD